LYLANCSNNTISGGIINFSSNDLVRVVDSLNDPSSDNLFKDMVLTGATKNDTWVEGNSVNNIFLNVSYNSTKEYVEASSQLIRKWYYSANVTNTSYVAISDAYVSIYNVSGNLIDNISTGADGLTNNTELIEYINDGGTRSWFNNYTMNATHPSYNHTFKIHNLSVEKNIRYDMFILGVVPVITSITLIPGIDWIRASCFASNAVYYNLSINGTNESSGWISICSYFFTGLTSETDYNVSFIALSDTFVTNYSIGTTLARSPFNWTPYGNIKGFWYLQLLEFWKVHTNQLFLWNSFGNESIKLWNDKGTVKLEGPFTVKGDFNETGNFSGNQIYGEMWYHNHTPTELNFAVDGRFYNLSFSNSSVNGFIFNNSEDCLEALFAGKYSVSYMASGDGQNNHVYYTAVLVNGINQNHTESHKKMSAGSDIVTMTGSGFIDLNIGDEIKLATADVGATGTGNLYSSNLNLFRIGD